MTWLQNSLRTLQTLQKRSRQIPYLGRCTFALGLLVMLLLVTQGHHLDNPPEIQGYEVRDGQLIAEAGTAQPASPLLRWVSISLPYLNAWMLIGGGVFISILLRQWGHLRKLVVPLWVAGISVAAWAVAQDLALHLGTMQLSEMGEPPATTAYGIKLGFLIVATLCIPAMAHFYKTCGALDRYTLRTFLAPLTFCFLAFTALWLIMDLLDNLKDFQEAQAPFGRVVLFYLSVLPFIFINVMPASLLLAVLYTLTKMSRANEIIAMLSTGRSVLQVLRPILVVAALVAILSCAANYYWAPRAEGKKDAVIRGLAGKQKDSIRATAVMHNDPVTKRTWFIGTMPFSLHEDRLRSVQVREHDAKGQVIRVIHADSALWRPQPGWRFFDGKEVLYRDGQAHQILPFPTTSSGVHALDKPQFEETPWSMISYALQPDYMSVPEITSYLAAHQKDGRRRLAPFHTHYYQRFALPWQSFALALVAAPLGIAYSRRGAVGGITGAIFIFFGLLFLNNLCLNLGKGGIVPAPLSPWIPHLLFGTLGLILLYYRSQNKDLPSLNPLAWLRPKATIARPKKAA
jgi:LPS export ABC transporter permease LptG